MRDKDREFISLLQGGVFFFFRLDTKEKEPKKKIPALDAEKRGRETMRCVREVGVGEG
ncbi:hypothetical protein NXX38_23040 [Bacteroides sp. BFG-637]|uniref:hypothetical protein n=1 Tax=Bacteroides sp. BFG-637 TaxID=2972764 RepID=UPI0021657499|nr:hypothetical protein [Bacteroides sp. BFG-637]MCS3314561.1 hypothetical protein [Bacteroides sp. BFG-637]